MFIEIELIKKSENFEKDLCELLNIMEDLKIDLNMVERKKYIDYISVILISLIAVLVINNYVINCLFETVILSFFFKMIICAVIPNIIICVLCYKTEEFMYFVQLIKRIIKGRIK